MKDFFFDYIYYRLNKFYYKWDGENGITSIIGVSMIQCLVVSDIFLIFERLIISKSEVTAKGDSKTIAYIAVGMFLSFIVFNVIRYRNKYKIFKERWENEERSERIKKGIFVLLSLIIPWIIILLLANF